MTITKVSETEFKEVTKQADLEVVRSLDTLLAEKANLEQGLQNNQEAIVHLSSELEKVNDTIKAVKELGLKTKEELSTEQEEAAQADSVAVLENNS